MTLSIVTLSITHDNKKTELDTVDTFKLSDVMLRIVNKPIMLSAIMLNVVMLSVN